MLGCRPTLDEFQWKQNPHPPFIGDECVCSPMPQTARYRTILNNTIQQLEEKGWRVILLPRKDPTAIAARGEEIIAIIIAEKKKRNPGPKGSRGYRLVGGRTFEYYRHRHSAFDNIHFTVFYKDRPDVERYWDNRATN